MISERQHDGIDRVREQWFRRANTGHPERGGASKSRSFHGREWVEQARARWAELTNARLDHAGRQERVDHRSYKRQGVDRDPGHHYGPAAAHMMTRSEPHDRLTAVAEVADDRDRLGDVEREIAALEVVRGALVHEVEERFSSERGEGSGGSHGGGWSRDEALAPWEVAVGSALDAFRAQQAAEQIHARLTEVAGLLGQLRSQADALANSEDLRVVLRQEQSWLDSARRTVAEVRHWRHEEQKRYWPGVMQRWAVALVFALAASATAGAGYGWVTSPYAAELVSPRARIHLAEFIEHRLVTMTNAERRQFETLMRWDAGPKR